MTTKQTLVSSPNTTPKGRILNAALELFSKHGVAGTSLQMIANTINVTKAAVYHQYNSKDEIIFAVAQLVIEKLEWIAILAESQPSLRHSRELLMDKLILFTVENRHVAIFLQTDPAMLRLFRTHEPFCRLMERFNNILLGEKQTPELRVIVAFLMTAHASTVMHPIVYDIDDEVLFRQLDELSRSLLTFLD